MPAYRCTEHPHDGPHRRNGRCQFCQKAARKRYAARCRDALRALKAELTS